MRPPATVFILCPFKVPFFRKNDQDATHIPDKNELKIIATSHNAGCGKNVRKDVIMQNVIEYIIMCLASLIVLIKIPLKIIPVRCASIGPNARIPDGISSKLSDKR